MGLCKGRNCEAVNGVGHSNECIDDHNELYKEYETIDILTEQEKEEAGSILRRLCCTVFNIKNNELKDNEINLLIKAVGDDWEQKVDNLRNSGIFIL